MSTGNSVSDQEQLQPHESIERRPSQHCPDDGEPTSETTASRKQAEKQVRLFILITATTVAELVFDFVTTIISFVTITSTLIRFGFSLDCCGTKFAIGGLTLGTTIAFVVLLLLELILFSCSTSRLARRNEDQAETDEGSLNGESDDTSVKPCACPPLATLVSWLMVLNPFFGCVMLWAMLHDFADRKKVLIVLGLQTGSIVVMFARVYLQRDQLTYCTFLLRVTPLFPFAVGCFVTWYYLQKEGMCVQDGQTWADSCVLCENFLPPPDGGACESESFISTYCGDTVETQFCYFDRY